MPIEQLTSLCARLSYNMVPRLCPVILTQTTKGWASQAHRVNHHLLIGPATHHVTMLGADLLIRSYAAVGVIIVIINVVTCVILAWFVYIEALDSILFKVCMSCTQLRMCLV